MTQEDKELLSKDLCARFPYRVKVQYDNQVCKLVVISDDCTILLLGEDGYKPNIEDDLFLNIEKVKPYLRPMSSMTEEEKKDLLVTIVGNEGVKYFQVLSDGSIDNTDATVQDLNKFNMHWVNFDRDTVTSYLDWLNAHHFDYRGLIKKGLALEAPKGMYN